MAIDWKAVRMGFEAGASTTAELAKIHGCREGTIAKRAKKEGWSPDGGASKDGFDDHKSLWRGVKKRLVKGLETSDVKAGLEELKVAKMAGEVLTSVIKGERLAMGLEPPAGSEADDTEDITGEMEDATAPRGTGAAVDGE
ncbi:MAG: hypothetical protein HY894_07860 [Deltaproteobacteria bacterium]|nr:hypothetical protein [Deltaproteobacteria bacterium]